MAPEGFATLGDHLRHRRILLGLTLDAAGAAVGVDGKKFSHWERLSVRRPRGCNWSAVTTFLGYDPRLAA
ncbi:helix-turn-helix domain-containing protein [Longimicrobium sp.]|uniref:helix-turn-helix domain-containing protein n=1 Tax=Longimicrobium sp. TaxID=2029185 RepID=UPI0039C92D97